MPTISASELAAKLGISKSVISKLEDKNLKDFHDGKPGDVPPCKASTLKLYHDEFNCSYEYLMGETMAKTPEYYSAGQDAILGLFDDSFWDNLKKLLNDEGHKDTNLFMLQLFMSDPVQLQDFMETAFHYLYEISTLNKMKDIGRADREIMTAPLWASLRERFEALMPKLEHGFRKYEQRKADERATFEEDIAADDAAANAAAAATNAATIQPIVLGSRGESQE